uniref:PilZ domain-containing protein n=1 Tax=Sphingomonas bacterium TaxID=1895847 RepID=UPI00260A0147|nr:PilZ domain-containing protein [Sphingomonas bacterium]
MILRAQIFHCAAGDLREADRAATDVGATLRARSGAPLDVHIHDLSRTGFAMESAEELRLDQTIWIGLSGVGISAARVVRRIPGGWACQFMLPITEREHQAALAARSTVVATPWTDLQTVAAAEPDATRWPFLARVAFVVGSSVALWAAIFWIFF